MHYSRIFYSLIEVCLLRICSEFHDKIHTDFSGIRVYKDLTLLNIRNRASANITLFTQKTQADLAPTPALILISVADDYKRSNKQI